MSTIKRDDTPRAEVTELGTNLNHCKPTLTKICPKKCALHVYMYICTVKRILDYRVRKIPDFQDLLLGEKHANLFYIKKHCLGIMKNIRGIFKDQPKKVA